MSSKHRFRFRTKTAYLQLGGVLRGGTLNFQGLVLIFMIIILPAESSYAETENNSPEIINSMSKSQTVSEQLLTQIEQSERSITELIDSDIQIYKRTRLRAYEIAGVTAVTGSLMIVGALAGGVVTALALGVGSLTIYTAIN